MKPAFFIRKPQAELPQATAEQLLANVFDACGREPSSVPLDALTSYSNYRKERYALQRTIIILILILFLLLPLLFAAARIQVTLTNPDSRANPIYTVRVQTRIPIRQIQATLSGQTVPMYEDAPGEYTVSPRENGDMELCVTLLNRQETAIHVTVGTADSDAPVLQSTEFDADCVYFYVSDESGVDFAAVTVSAEDGTISAPLRCVPDTGCIAVAYPDSTINVRIPDLRGNVLQILLRPQA